MALIGTLLAVGSGIGYGTSAALQKREASKKRVPLRKLLLALAKRRPWLLAMLLEALSWGAQVIALSHAPVAVVIPLLQLGTGVLVVIGMRWLGERFGWMEMAAVGVIVVGSAAAFTSAGTKVSRTSLGVIPQVLIGLVALAAASLALWRRLGITYGIAAGFLYAGTTIFSKEIGDAFTTRGAGAVPRLAASPAPWMLIVLTIVAAAFIQAGFQRANAASVVAAMTSIDTAGPILAGFLLYHEPYPSGWASVVLP